MNCMALRELRGLERALAASLFDGEPCARKAGFLHYYDMKNAEGKQIVESFCWQHSRMSKDEAGLLKIEPIK